MMNRCSLPEFCSAYSVSDENKSNAGSVEAIQEHPSDSNKVQ